MKQIQSILVVGAGVMGNGIALVCARSGLEVILVDLDADILQKAVSNIERFLDGSVERKKMTQDEADTILSRIKGTTDLKEAAGDVDLIIEAIVEDIDIKKDTFRELDQICRENTIFASNTSAQCITEMAMVTKRSDKFLGMHWFNPPQLMRGIEVIVTDRTSQENSRSCHCLLSKYSIEISL